MVKKSRFIFICLTFFTALLLFSACTTKKDSKENKTGGYSQSTKLTESDKKIFEEATAKLVGVEYEPLKVSTQVVNGTNYKFYAKATTVSPEKKEYYADIYVYKSLDDEKPELVKIKELDK